MFYSRELMCRAKSGSFSAKGETIVTKLPDMSNVKWSEAQKAHRKQMRHASKYAAAALADPELRAYYEAEAEKLEMQPSHVAIADYLNGKNLLSKS